MKDWPLIVCFSARLCRLQEEIAQREDAESNMQGFRQVQYVIQETALWHADHWKCCGSDRWKKKGGLAGVEAS